MAYGLRPVRHAGGGTIRYNAYGSYKIASGYGTALYRGDPVKRTADGTIIRDTAGSTVTCGVFWGVRYKDTTTGEYRYQTFWPASTTATEIEAYVYDDPEIIFMVEADQDTTAITASDVGEYADVIVNAGNATTKVSGVQLDSSNIGTSIGQCIVLGSAEDDESYGTTSVVTDLYVRFAEHAYVQFPTATG